MTVERLLPPPEARELVQLAADVADKVLDPIVDEHEKNETYTTFGRRIIGGYGYPRDYRVERYMREAKITQIFKGTYQIQRLVIGRSLVAS